MVRRKERLGKGEKSIIQRKELHSEPCWCELYESEKWRTIKRDVKIGNMLFEHRTWFSSLPTDAWSCHSFYRWPRKKTTAKLFELLPLQSDTWKGTVCPLSFHATSWPSCLPQIVPDCPSWDRQHYDGRSRGKPRLPVGLGLPWKQKKKAVLCLDTLRDSVHFSLQGYRSSPLSRLGLSSEGGWHSMSRLTLFLSNFPFFCLKEFLPNYCPATQGLNLLFPSLLLSQGAGQYLPHSDSTCFVLCSCAVACVEASHYFF